MSSSSVRKFVGAAIPLLVVSSVVLDLQQSFAAPSLALYVCAAALSVYLRRVESLAVCLATIALVLLMPLFSGDPNAFWMNRVITVLAIGLLVSFHFLPANSAPRETQDFTELSLASFSDPLCSSDALTEALLQPPRDENSQQKDVGHEKTGDTEIHKTEHASRHERENFSLDYTEDPGFVEPALDRLRQAGQFSRRQMKLIGDEMRGLEARGLLSDFADCVPPGTRIGRFVIDKQLGRGGEGSVYRARGDNSELAAIKLLHNMKVSDRFRREMHLVRQLAHPNIVTAYEVGEYSGLPFITMEFLSGPDLYRFIKENGALGWLDATRYILQAARALSHAHQRDLLHRDVKPGNMILHGTEQIKLVDLGLATHKGESDPDSVYRFVTHKGHLAGTLPFMAPEQARSLANATIQSDIYGLGATWFYLLTGKERLVGNSFSEQFENLLIRHRFRRLPSGALPKSLARIYRQMVAYGATDRIKDCRILSWEIEDALQKAGQAVLADAINVMVVEDSLIQMRFTLEMLRRSNSTLLVHKAKTLGTCIDLCHKMDIDLVLLDLSLPDSTGVETVKTFRRQFPTIPLVVLSGMDPEEIGAACLTAGADAFIGKDGLTPHRMERTIFVTLSRRAQFSSFSGNAKKKKG